jgi:arylsulfatase A-like enzyme
MASRLAKRIVVGGGVVAAALAGLHLYNEARLDAGMLRANLQPVLEQAQALSGKAKPEYQELALATLPPNPRSGSFFRLEEMLDRAVVKEAPAPAKVAHGVIQSLEFDDPTSPELKAAQGKAEIREGLLRVVSDGDDHLVNAVSIAVPRDDVGDILIRARADKGNYLRLAWAGRDGSADGRIWRNKLDVRFTDHDGFHTYTVNGRNVLKRGLMPGEKLEHLYLQPADIAGATVELDFIRFVSKASRYAEADHGVDYETIGTELRRALYMRPDQTLEFPLRVPERQPRLDFGMGVLLDQRPMRFEVALTRADGTSVPLHDAAIGATAGWADARIDLAPWAGQEVRLSLRVSGDPANVAFWSSPIVSSAPSQPFNVIVLVEDAERADYLSVYGHPTRTTPFKEKLMAERGVLFEHAIAQATKTRPSVAAYMTSLYPTATGLWHFSDVLSERHLTLAEILRAQGYVTASFLQNGNAGPFAGLHQGFDRLFDNFGQTTEDVFTGAPIMQWLEQHRDRNFFLYLHAINPHAPYDPPSPYREQRLADLPQGGGTAVQRNAVFDAPWVEQPTVETRRRLYEAEIMHNDKVVEEFFRRLDAMGLSENTLVVMMSDHGEYLGDRGFFGNRMWDHRPPGYMVGTHVPLMFVYPGRFATPKRIAAPVQLIDVMPTVLELAGVERGDLLLQGQSLTGLIDGERPDYWRDRVIVSEEPTAMLKGDPCSCGSLYFRDWHVLSSSWMWPRDHLYLPDLQAFLATNVLAVDKPRGESLAASFLPDLLVRSRQRSFLTELREANMAAWRKLTEGDAGGRVIDPDTLERLRGLGYVN